MYEKPHKNLWGFSFAKSWEKQYYNIMQKQDLSTYHILVVDDDNRIRTLVQRFLVDEGFTVASANSAKQARELMQTLSFDLLVLDVMMPDETGIEFTHDIRKTSSVPILMLTAMGEIDDRLNGLNSGADDYLQKPFEPKELSLRIQSILRRSTQSNTTNKKGNIIALGEFSFDTNRSILLHNDNPVKLTSAETSLLSILASQTGRVRSREELTELCNIDGGDRAIDVQITRLRRKIEPDTKTPQYIQTIRGQGYILYPSHS